MASRIPFESSKRDADIATPASSTKSRIRRSVVALGAWLPDGIVRKFGNLVREVELRQWMTRHGLNAGRTVGRREELFEMVGREIGDKPALYVEFGVAQGEATRIWSRLLRHRATVLHGFDSFEGLPERWLKERPKGMFSTGGALPDIDDPRVQFFKGWFHETLPAYEPPRREVGRRQPGCRLVQFHDFGA